MIDIRNPCSLRQAAISVCNEQDVAAIAKCHHNIIIAAEREELPTNLRSILAGSWQGMIESSRSNPNSAFAFKASSGGEVLGFITGRKNRLTDNDVVNFSTEISLLGVSENARRYGLGRRLLSCLAASFYSSKFRNTFIMTDDEQIVAFASRLGARLHGIRPKSNVKIFAWDDLLPLILDAYHSR